MTQAAPASELLTAFQRYRIASVSDDEEAHGRVASALERSGFRPAVRSNWREAAQRIGSVRPDLIVADVRRPESGRDARKLLEQRGRTPVVLLGQEDVLPELARLISAGANDYLTDPYSPGELSGRVCVALAAARPEQGRASAGPLLLGESPAFRQVLDQIELVAPKNATVLITGETGTGKERVAQALHAASGRAKGPLVSVNCAGVPAPLLEDEFFGHVKGAFTDAYRTRPGRFEQANEGTIFLDEIGDLPLDLQPKLLRVLQERVVSRLGGIETTPVDVRVIAATNADLRAAVADRSFREDLFYRINVFPIHVPALRERRTDIPLLIRHFLDVYSKRERIAPKTLDPAAEPELMARLWPGNIRELENAVEIAAIQSRDEQQVRLQHFPLSQTPGRSLLSDLSADQPLELRRVVARFENELIQRALDRNAGNKTQAADELGVKRTTLIEKIKKLSRELGVEAAAAG